jgi:hypothetical protein
MAIFISFINIFRRASNNYICVINVRQTGDSAYLTQGRLYFLPVFFLIVGPQFIETLCHFITNATKLCLLLQPASQSVTSEIFDTAFA